MSNKELHHISQNSQTTFFCGDQSTIKGILNPSLLSNGYVVLHWEPKTFFFFKCVFV